MSPERKSERLSRLADTLREVSREIIEFLDNATRDAKFNEDIREQPQKEKKA